MAINCVLINCNLVTNQTKLNMCTWMAMETIDFFTRNGSDVYICTMDCRKPSIRLGLLIVMYRGQSGNVRWNNTFSKQFPLSNGFKQGAVLSVILFCVYLNDLLDTT